RYPCCGPELECNYEIRFPYFLERRKCDHANILLSPDTFTETCGNLIQRMINNVPNGVSLTDPISELFDYLVDDPLLSYLSASSQSQHNLNLSQTLGVTAERYFFNVTINTTSSISKFWFEINENDSSDSVVVDNGGSGFLIEQDALFVDSIRS
ncbi:hypothetical protein BT96DRAFT_1101961, partial [Gymnopus androsaceus JB14]